MLPLAQKDTPEFVGLSRNRYFASWEAFFNRASNLGTIWHDWQEKWHDYP
jgi:hypothetical protein